MTERSSGEDFERVLNGLATVCFYGVLTVLAALINPWLAALVSLLMFISAAIIAAEVRANKKSEKLS